MHDININYSLALIRKLNKQNCLIVTFQIIDHLLMVAIIPTFLFIYHQLWCLMSESETRHDRP